MGRCHDPGSGIGDRGSGIGERGTGNGDRGSGSGNACHGIGVRSESRHSEDACHGVRSGIIEPGSGKACRGDRNPGFGIRLGEREKNAASKARARRWPCAFGAVASRRGARWQSRNPTVIMTCSLGVAWADRAYRPVRYDRVRVPRATDVAAGPAHDPERYRSGRNGGASKASCRVTGTWVRIPPSPPPFAQDQCEGCPAVAAPPRRRTPCCVAAIL